MATEEAFHDSSYINHQLSRLCAEATVIATDILGLDGELDSAATLAIASNAHLARLRAELQTTIELDEGHRLNDPSSEVWVLGQAPFYWVTADSIEDEGVYSNLRGASGAASVQGSPDDIVMAYHKDEVLVPKQGHVRIPGVKMCLLIGSATIRSMNGEAKIDKVLFPFTERNRILPSIPGESAGSETAD